MRGLSKRMRRFAGEYVKDFCAAKAALRAGYAESFAKARASELLQDGRGSGNRCAGTEESTEVLGWGEAREATQESGMCGGRGRSDGGWEGATSNAGATQASGVCGGRWRSDGGWEGATPNAGATQASGVPRNATEELTEVLSVTEEGMAGPLRAMALVAVRRTPPNYVCLQVFMAKRSPDFL